MSSKQTLKKLIIIGAAAITALSGLNLPVAMAEESSCDVSTTTVLINCDFTNLDLSGKSFVGYAIVNSDFSGANLKNTNFSGVNLSSNRFATSKVLGPIEGFVNVDQDANTNSRVTYSAPIGVFTRSEMRVQSMWNSSCGASVEVSVSGDKSTIELWGGNYPDTCYGHPKKFFGKLYYSWMGYRNTDLSNADLSNANLSGVDLSGAVLSGANVSNTDFTGAVLDRVVSGSLGGSVLALPDPWQLIRGYLVGPKASLVGANLSGLNLWDMDFSGADLTNARFDNSNLARSKFVGTKLVGVNFVLSYLNSTDFSSANLTSSNLSKAWLENTNFTKANLTSVSRVCDDYWAGCREFWSLRSTFTGVILTGVKSSGLSFGNYWNSIPYPYGWTNRHGYLFGPSADLSGFSLRQLDLTNLNLSNADLSGVDLTGSNLNGTDLSNANLNGVSSAAVTGTPVLPAGWKLINGYLVGPRAKVTNANFSKTNLYGLDLTGVDFTNTNLTGANLWGANLTNANLTNANLTKARLDRVISAGVVGSPILPSAWQLADGVLLGPDFQLPSLSSLANADLSGLDLSELNFSGLTLSGTNFANTNLSGANLSRTDLSGANLSGANLNGANLSNSDLSGANLAGANAANLDFSRAILTGANVAGVNLSSADLSYVKSGGVIGLPAALPSGWLLLRGYFFGSSANLSNANLSGVDFSKLDLTKVTLSGANLAGANLSGLKLAGVSMSGLNLSGANLAGTDLSNADLSNANLSGVDLSGAVLSGANVSNTDFTGAVLDRVVSGSLGGSVLALPDPWQLIRGYLVGPKASLVGANLSGLDLRNWDLSGADLTSAALNNSIWHWTKFVAARLVNANFDRSYIGAADFTGADLTGANLSWAEVGSGTNFTRAKLINVRRDCYYWYGCNYGYSEFAFNSSTILTGVRVSGFNPGYNFNSWLPAGWTSRYGYLFGPSADLSGFSLRQLDLTNLNLSNADLSGVDLTGSNLNGTDLSNANLNGVSSAAVTGTPVLPAGWKLINGYLVGPRAKVTNANFSKTNLYGLDLTGVDFTNTNLTGANLWGANLTNANLTNTNLSGADISQATLSGANLTSAVMDSVTAEGLVGIPTNLPKGWVIVDGKFVGSISIEGVVASGSLLLGKTLTAVAAVTPEGSKLDYQWLRNGTEIAGANSVTYQLSALDVGARISVLVTASKDSYVGSSVISPEVLVPSTFAALTNSRAAGNPVLGGLVTLTTLGKMDFSNLLYQVSRDSGQTWINLTGNTYRIVFEDLGRTLRFRVVQSAPGYISQTTDFNTISIDGRFSLPGYSEGQVDWANSGAAVQAIPYVGSMLKATRGQWTSNTRVTGFWWSSVGSAISSKLLYKVTMQDLGNTLRYVEVGVSPSGTVLYRLSQPVEIKPRTFDASSKPVITGSAALGNRVKANIQSAWLSGTKYSYQWLSNGVAVIGATGQLYTVGVNDIGSALSVRVCGSKAGYETKCELSLATPLIQKSQITTSAQPNIVSPGQLIEGSIIRGSVGRWMSGVTLKLQWLRDGIAIQGATDNLYFLKAEDFGHELTLQVTGTKAGFEDLVRVSAPKLVN